MHERISANQICFPDAALPKVLDAWAELGARRVSFVSMTLLEADLRALHATLTSDGRTVETVMHPFLARRALEPRESAWRDDRDKLARVIEIAATLGAKSIYMVTGGHGTLTWEEAADVFATAIAPCVAQARAAGVALMIENAPTVYADIHIAHSLRDTITLAETADIGVCIDIAGCWTEAGLQALIERALPRCQLVQVSDYVYGDRSYPSRAVPGDGAIPLQRILGWLLSAGYQGSFDLELLGPRIDAEGRTSAVRRAASKVGEILRVLGA
jgi:sugar phosphate isomerase/epimerase